MLAVEEEFVDVAVEFVDVAVEEAVATVDPVDDSKRLWTVDSLVVMVDCRVVTSVWRLLREVIWVLVHVTDADAILLATVLTDELVEL